MIKKAIFVSLLPLLTTVKAEESSQDWVDLALRKSGVFPPHPALVALVIVVIAAIYFMNR